MGISIERCKVCGKEFPTSEMVKVFTGRTQYVCEGCRMHGTREVTNHRYGYFATYEGRKRLKDKGGSK